MRSCIKEYGVALQILI